MSLALRFDLRLEERADQRVVVSVLLAPEPAGARIDGVSLQIVNRQGEPLSSRMVLPISGELHQPMLSTIELRATQAIPQGSRVVGTAWSGTDQREASLPTDPFTEFERHVRAHSRLGKREDEDEDEDEERLLERLDPDERARIAAHYPWIDEPRLTRAIGELTVVDEEQDPEEAFDDLVDELGIDDESAEWLKDLMSEES